jgi:hypothetical protein
VAYCGHRHAPAQWRARRKRELDTLPPRRHVVLVPGATDIQVVTSGWGQWQISYGAPDPLDAWYFTLARRLEAEHWTLQNRWRPDGPAPTYDPIVPLRFEHGYAGVLWDEVVLVPDRGASQRATITLHRRISIPWWRFWPSPAH